MKVCMYVSSDTVIYIAIYLYILAFQQYTQCIFRFGTVCWSIHSYLITCPLRLRGSPLSGIPPSDLARPDSCPASSRRPNSSRNHRSRPPQRVPQLWSAFPGASGASRASGPDRGRNAGAGGRSKLRCRSQYHDVVVEVVVDIILVGKIRRNLECLPNGPQFREFVALCYQELGSAHFNTPTDRHPL